MSYYIKYEAMENPNDLSSDLDRCHSKTHYDFAVLTHKMLKHMFKYIGHNVWHVLDNDGWSIDNKQENLIHSVKTIVFDKLQERVSFYDKLKESFYNIDTVRSNDYAQFSILLQVSSLRLKDQKFIKNLIKELKSFFYVETYNI